MEFLRRATANGRRPAYALKLDVADFFPSIDKRVLYRLIARRIRDPEVRWLTRVLLFHDPTRSYRWRALDRRAAPPETPGSAVPARKSLFGKGNRRGLPIGNLTSQFWGNVYLNDVDHFVRRELGCRHYLRYVDDMVLLGEDRDELTAWRNAIEGFLRERRHLRLRHEGGEPVPVREGVDFVGWRTWWNHRLPRRQTLARITNRIAEFEWEKVETAFGGAACRIELRLDFAEEALSLGLASYAGHLGHGASWQWWSTEWESRPWLRALFDRREWRVTRRWPPRSGLARRFADQYRRLMLRAGDDCLLFLRMGRYVEFYGRQRLLAERHLGLRCIRLPRASFALTAGFPLRLEARFARRALARGFSVARARRRRRANVTAVEGVVMAAGATSVSATVTPVLTRLGASTAGGRLRAP